MWIGDRVVSPLFPSLNKLLDGERVRRKMSCYISSNNERVYVALESSYGVVPAITGANRIPLLKLGAKQVAAQTSRKDKTGSRTFPGLPNAIRRITSFSLDTL